MKRSGIPVRLSPVSGESTCLIALTVESKLGVVHASCLDMILRVLALWPCVSWHGRQPSSEDLVPRVATEDPEIKAGPKPPVIETQRPEVTIAQVPRNEEARQTAGGEHQQRIRIMDSTEHDRTYGEGKRPSMPRRGLREIGHNEGLHQELLDHPPQGIEHQQEQHVPAPDECAGDHAVQTHGTARQDKQEGWPCEGAGEIVGTKAPARPRGRVLPHVESNIYRPEHACERDEDPVCSDTPQEEMQCTCHNDGRYFKPVHGMVT